MSAAETARVEPEVAFVTGAASGLGAAVSRSLGARGTHVVCADVDEVGAQRIADEVGGTHLALDVSDLEANRQAMRAVRADLGGLDLVHLNAGVSTMMGIGPEFDLERYRKVMGVNLDGVVFGLHAAVEVMREQGTGGSIVATASLAGLTAVPFDPLYAANKHAVVGLVRSVGPALVGEGIRVNAICPGFAESKIIGPIREMLASQGIPIIPAETVAAAILELFDGDMAGECRFVQAGRESGPFAFRNIPGPRGEAQQD